MMSTCPGPYRAQQFTPSINLRTQELQQIFVREGIAGALTRPPQLHCRGSQPPIQRGAAWNIA
jgi:hypothetical protein